MIIPFNEFLQKPKVDRPPPEPKNIKSMQDLNDYLENNTVNIKTDFDLSNKDSLISKAIAHVFDFSVKKGRIYNHDLYLLELIRLIKMKMPKAYSIMKKTNPQQVSSMEDEEKAQEFAKKGNYKN